MTKPGKFKNLEVRKITGIMFVFLHYAQGGKCSKAVSTAVCLQSLNIPHALRGKVLRLLPSSIRIPLLPPKEFTPLSAQDAASAETAFISGFQEHCYERLLQNTHSAIDVTFALRKGHVYARGMVDQTPLKYLRSSLDV